MEIKNISSLDMKMDEISIRFEKIKFLLEDSNNSTILALNNMSSVSHGLTASQGIYANKMKKIINVVDRELSTSSLSQNNRVESLQKRFSSQQKNRKALDNKENYINFSQFEISLDINELEQEINNIGSWNKPEYSYKKIEFNNYRGLRGKIFSPIANYNRKSEKLAQAIYEVESLMNEASKEYLTIELNRLTQLQGHQETNALLTPTNRLVEHIAGFKPTQESHSVSISSIENQNNTLITVSPHRCMGRTAMCGITH